MNIIEKLKNYSYKELREFAKKNGREHLYDDLLKGRKNLDELSSELNLSQEYQEYMKEVMEEIDVNRKTAINHMLNFNDFILAHICFSK